VGISAQPDSCPDRRADGVHSSGFGRCLDKPQNIRFHTCYEGKEEDITKATNATERGSSARDTDSSNTTSSPKVT